jgi:hypothetical protein
MPLLKQNLLLRNLNSDSRYKALLARMKLAN